MTAPAAKRASSEAGDRSARLSQFARRWLPAILLGVAALAVWQAAERRDTDVVSTQPIDYDLELATPMLSARRIPRTIQAPVVDDRLGRVLRAMIADSPVNTCLQVQIDDRIIPPSSRTGAGLVPASNQKVLTTYGAILVLGEDFRFVTTVVADGPIAGGVLDGDLYFVGDGDPFLSTENWWTQYETLDGRHNTSLETLADAIAATGIVEVTGAVIGDESRFDAERLGPWAERLINGKHSGPLSALTVNEGFNDWPEVYVTARQRRETDDPPVHAASVLAQLLADRGITIAEAPTSGIAPDNATPVAEIESPPLLDILTHVNSYSSNLGAELLIKRIGFDVAGEGSTSAGTAVLLQALDEAGIPVAGLVIDDGSGLAESNRLTCQAMAGVLAAAGPDSDFAQTMAIGGERGTLAGRMVDTAAEGRVFAKTGTLQDATALSGYVESQEDPDIDLVFAYIVNDGFVATNETVLALQDVFAASLTGYPGRPPVDDLLPLSPEPR